MPTIYRFGPYRFRFYSREHEPPHVHVVAPGCTAIVTLGPIRLVKVQGYTGRQQKEIERLTLEHAEEFLRRWHDHFPR